MNPYIKVGAAIAAVLIVAVVGWNLLPGSSSLVGGPGPTPSPSPSASPPELPAGNLTPGDYIARAGQDDRMAFTVTVPEGWTGFGGWALSGPRGSNGPAGSGIAVLHGPLVSVDPCDPAARTPSPAPGVRTVDDVVADLSARGDLHPSGVTPSVLGGYAGTRLDLQMPAEAPCSEYYVFAEPQGFYSQGASNRWRVWVVDADGETAVVVLSDFPGTSVADHAAAQAVIDSVRISP